MRHSPQSDGRGPPPQPYDLAMPDSGVRLSEVLVALSAATDLGLGQPAEHMVRAARIGMRIGGRLGLSQDELADLYDVSLLTYVGCPIYGNEAAALFGDDIDFRARAIEVDLAGRPAAMFLMRRAGSGASPLQRARQVAGVLATGGRAMVEQMANHCSAAGQLADRLGLSAGSAGRRRAVLRPLGRPRSPLRSFRQGACALGPDRACGRGVRGLRAHDRNRRGPRDGAVAARNPLRPRDRRRGAERSRLVYSPESTRTRRARSSTPSRFRARR